MDFVNIFINKIYSLSNGFIENLPLAILSFVVLAITYFVSKFAVKILRHSVVNLHLRPSIIEVFKKLLSITIWCVGFFIAVTILVPSITFANLITALGLGSIALGFAFKDILENFIAGVLILIRETFHIKDIINCNEYEGRVEEITIRDTHIRRADGQKIVLPNAFLFNNPIRVISDAEQKKVSITVSLENKLPVNKVVDILLNAIKNVPDFDHSNAKVFADKISLWSIDYQMTWWLPMSDDAIASRHNAIFEIQKALLKSDINIVSLE